MPLGCRCFVQSSWLREACIAAAFGTIVLQCSLHPSQPDARCPAHRGQQLTRMQGGDWGAAPSACRARMLRVGEGMRMRWRRPQSLRLASRAASCSSTCSSSACNAISFQELLSYTAARLEASTWGTD